jgi:hypothetical protein
MCMDAWVDLTILDCSMVDDDGLHSHKKVHSVSCIACMAGAAKLR